MYLNPSLMPLSDDKLLEKAYQDVVAQFNASLGLLLSRYKANRRDIEKLLREQQQLKDTLSSQQGDRKEIPDQLSRVLSSSKKDYIAQIDRYIKYIEDCLTYLEDQHGSTFDKN